MRVLVTGATGQVGWELCRSLQPLAEVRGLSRADCDLAKPRAVTAACMAWEPDVIVNAAAYTGVDQAECEEALATAINGAAAGVLAEAARQLGALFLHFSTDYVFDGCGSARRDPAELPAPINAYGRSKLAGERATAESGGDYLIVRTSWVYAGRGRNFLRTVLRRARAYEVLSIVNDQIGAPTWARNLADACAHLIRAAQQERHEGRFASAILHATAAGETSWHGFAATIIDEARKQKLLDVGQPAALRAIATGEYPTPARRPANSRLCGDALRLRYGLTLPDWRAALTYCLADLGANFGA